MKLKLKITHKIFIFSLFLVAAVIFGGIIINNSYLEKFYAHKKVAQIKEVRDMIGESGIPTDEELETYADKYNITINMRDNTNAKNNRWRQRYEFDENGEGDRIIKHMGMEQLEYYKKFPNGEILTLKISVDSIRSTVGIVNEFFIYEGIIILLCSLFYIYFSSKRITKPIIELNIIIKRMVKMDFSCRTNIKSGDEFQELGESVNFLSSELEKNINDLRLSNIKLNKEIENRKKIDELRKDFIASVTHEIKTPITVINTHAEMLLYDLIKDREEGKEYLKTIMSEGDNINSLLNELINIIKIEEENIDIKVEKIDISKLLLEESGKYRIDLSKKNVDLNLNLEKDVFVKGEEFKIRQVVTNFLSNSVSYVDDGGELKINLKKMEKKVIIEIINTGSSIPEDKIEDIWKAFYRVEKSRNRKYGGMGLGLTIVSGILKKHGSKFGVENIKNGVKFWFTLKKI